MRVSPWREHVGDRRVGVGLDRGQLAAAASPVPQVEPVVRIAEPEAVGQEIAMDVAPMPQKGTAGANDSAAEQTAPARSTTNVSSFAKPKAALPDEFDDVIDLPGADVSGRSILEAVLKKSSGDLVECPLRPPMCLEARLAVSRDRSLVLLAVANQGLHELQFIGQAYRWLKENRELIGMALPQFAIDPRQLPGLRILVDRADLTADILQPMLQSDHITVQAYRKLRWGEKRGVFLEAA